jgi:hypothetical protein
MIFADGVLPPGATTGPAVKTTADIVARAQVLRAQAIEAKASAAPPAVSPVTVTAPPAVVAPSSSFYTEHKTAILGGGLLLAGVAGFALYKRTRR